MMKLKNTFLSIVLLFPFLAFAQQSIKGKVTDKATNTELPGVNVVVKGTTNGTSTDFDGLFQINNVNIGDILVFTYIGYNDLEITVSSFDDLNVQIEESTESLDEVVIIGYGTTTVKDATGSVEAITAEDFTQGNIVTAENLLSGRVSGVNIITGGAPGSGSAIRIRGGSSISASNDPLIIIDGLPISNDGVNGSRGVLATINPNDIESFSVLKDASATAIYGSRAANGVIIISTKKGKQDFALDLDIQYNFGGLTDRIDVFSADAFRQIIAEQRPGDVDLLGTANTDWQDEVFRNTVSTIYNATATGSLFKAVPARLTAGFTNQQGALETSRFDRSNFSVSLNPSVFNDHLKVNFNFNIAFEDNRFGDQGQIGAALRYDPTQPVFDPDSPFGGFYQHRNGSDILNGTTNPLASLLQRDNRGENFRYFGNINFDYKFHFLPELRAVLNLGLDISEGEGADINSELFATRDPDLLFIGTESYGFQTRKNRLFDGYLNYKKDFGDTFGLDLTAGYSYQKFESSGGNSGNVRDPESFATTFADPDVVLIGFFGRANFSFFDKYLVTLNYRRDGTSRFSEENRWGDFAGAALAWRLSDEEFLKDSNVISELKLRASYGETGQQSLPGQNDIYLSRYRSGDNASQYFFGSAAIPIQLPSEINPDIKWEETSTIEFGIDYGLFDNRITGSISAYQKNSTDLLFDAAVPSGTNFTNSIIQNIGELEIQGLEFTVNADVIQKEDFNWNFNFNASFFDREIKELALDQDVRTGGIAGGTGSTIQLLREGEAPNSFYVFKQLYDEAGNPIEGAFVDLNGDGIVNDDDRYLKENPNPDVVLGFQSNLNYKNFDFAFNLRANLGNYVYNNVNSSRAQYELLQDNAVLGNIPTSVLNTNFQRTSDVISSDLYVENASFLRMDNVTLGYTFDRPIKKFSKNSIRLWAGVQNVFVITDYSGLDPEILNNDSPGVDNVIYPRSRNILVGANIKF